MSETDSTWEVVLTDRGAGMVCPFDDCLAKLLMNLRRIANLPGARMNTHSMICPVCERRSKIPEDYQ